MTLLHDQPRQWVEFTEPAPAHWASYFINADASGMTDAETKAADDWFDQTSQKGRFNITVKSDQSPYFGVFFGNWGDPDTKAGNLLDYTFYGWN